MKQEMKLAQNIRKYREKRHITQSALADMLKVSGGAVSKWERGITYPDIELLAPLARALHVTIDVLMSFTETLDSKQVTEIKQELIPMFLQDGFEKGEKKAENYLKRYSNCVELKLSIASLYSMYSSMIEDETCRMQKKLRALELLDDVILTKDSTYIYAAYFLRAQLNLELERYQECEEDLKHLSKEVYDPYIIYIQLYKAQNRYDDVELLLQQGILQSYTKLEAMLIQMYQAAQRDEESERAWYYLELLDNYESLFQIGYHSAYHIKYKHLIKQKDYAKAAHYFKAYIIDATNMEFDYKHHPLLNKVTLSTEPKMQKYLRSMMLKELLDEAETEYLNAYPDFQEACDIIKKTLTL